MADLILKVAPGDVRQKAQEITTQRGIMQGIMTDMQSKVTQLQDYWKSTSGEDYVSKYTSVQKNVQSSLDALQKHTNNLNDVANSYEQLEEDQLKKTQALSTANIF